MIMKHNYIPLRIGFRHSVISGFANKVIFEVIDFIDFYKGVLYSV